MVTTNNGEKCLFSSMTAAKTNSITEFLFFSCKNNLVSIEMSFAHSQKYEGPGEETVFINNFRPPVSLDSKTMECQKWRLFRILDGTCRLDFKWIYVFKTRY